MNIFNCEVPKGKGILCIIGGSGDTKIFWNKKNEDEVKNAKRTFDDLVKGKNFAAFSVSKIGRRNKKVTEFDPKIQKLILIPPMQGGTFFGGTPTQAVCAPTNIDAKEPFKRNDEAEIKAVTLLKKKIGEEQFIKLIATGYIEVKGKYGMYQINDNTILLHRTDKIGKKVRPLTYTLCVNVSREIGYIPMGDKLLSLYLSIKENENKFIETANFRFISTTDEYQERNNPQPQARST